MSVRAYRVIKKELADSSFNVWHDAEIVDFLEEDTDFTECWTGDGIGTIEVPVSRLRELLVAIPMHADDRRKKAIIEDVAWAEANGQEFVQYECF